MDLCQKVLDLQAGGTDAAEVNKYLLKHHCSARTVQGKQKRLVSLKRVLKKGMKFWQERLKEVQVGKHGLRKKGNTEAGLQDFGGEGLQGSWRRSEGPF